MSGRERVLCEKCWRANDPNAATCEACGAPLRPWHEDGTADAGGFVKGLIGFGAPIVVLSVASTLGRYGRVSPGLDLSGLVNLWFVAALLVAAAFVGAVVLHRDEQSGAGNGALTAFALGLVILLGTCAFNLSGATSGY